ncbi:Ribose transport system permease protein rbsC [uncultured Roseburia sp.]|uniref:ABC transporter permease n=1 Tax=Brotonthovivens ammoniilytica TaxID=2981725 RepID=A0ABT2TN51_9FIRM|nr:ABC transporter permease [Brotonthovivens ammoniilytica]MCU6763654.1 ABC transporter permease [Brotonthovivens ammoniilytica]SCJ29546.1 Ribose transport system permease protein rbsC [uncultured Roseburia sp.]
MTDTKSTFSQKINIVWRALVGDYKCILIFLGIFIVLSCVSDAFLTTRNLTNVLRQICASTTLGIGFTLVVASGSIDLSVGTMVGMIGTFAALLATKTAMPAVFIVVLALGIGLLAGLLNGLLISKVGLPFFIATIATMSIFEGVNYLACNNSSVTGIPEWFKSIGQGHAGPIPVPVIMMLVMVAFGTLLIKKTTFGRNALAIGGNKEAARVCGVNTKRVEMGVFIFMGICAAVTALILTGRAASAQTSAGQGMEMDAIAAVVIGGTPLSGGKGSMVGTFVGCLIVGCINNGLNLLNVDSNWQLIAKGLLIIIAVFIDVQSSHIRNKMLKNKAQKVK